MKLFLFWGIAFALTTWAGSEGPCPVPSLNSHVAKKWHSTRQSVTGIAISESSGQVFARYASGRVETISRSYEGSTSLLAPWGLLHFFAPWDIRENPNFKRRPLPHWLSKAEPIYHSHKGALIALPLRWERRVRYLTYQTAFATRYPKIQCLSPWLSNLKIAFSHRGSSLLFYQLGKRGRNVVAQFRLNLDNCHWHKTPVPILPTKEKVTSAAQLEDGVLFFAGRSTYWQTQRGTHRYHLSGNVVLPLSNNSVLIHGAKKALQIFQPTRLQLIPVLDNVPNISPTHIGYDAWREKLFVAGSVEQPAVRGVYEFSLGPMRGP